MVCITIDHPKQCQTKYVVHLSSGRTCDSPYYRSWNWMWTDMMHDDRTNFMRYGKGPRGLIGTQSNPTYGKVQGRVDKAVTLTIRKVQ